MQPLLFLIERSVKYKSYFNTSQEKNEIFFI